jgi:hypothetical protein
MSATRILERCLELAKTRQLPVIESLGLIGHEFPANERELAQSLFEHELVQAELGWGERFEIPVIEKALTAARLLEIERHPSKHSRPAKQASDGAVVVGQTIETFTTLALQRLLPPTETCDYRFSRKVGRKDIMDVPSGTSLLYVGNKLLYTLPSSKRMIFRIIQGTPCLLNGSLIELPKDLHVAGVNNHIDPNDPYNKHGKRDR